MTKEYFLRLCVEEDGTTFIDTNDFKKFFESNICIPKGETIQAFIGGKWKDVLTNDENFNYRIKPLQHIYEWQYAHDNGHGKAITSERYYTDKEYERFVDCKENCIKLPWTKRERQ